MPFVAGNEIDAFCERCNKDTPHTVIEAHSGLVHEVRCMACKATHRYQRPHSVPKPKKPAAKPRQRRAVKKRAAPAGPPPEWQDRIMGREPENAKPYSIKTTYDLNDVIEHTKFGFGVVTGLYPDGKIEVAFREALKVLVHGRA
jgi:ribosomal protein L44E